MQTAKLTEHKIALRNWGAGLEYKNQRKLICISKTVGEKDSCNGQEWKHHTIGKWKWLAVRPCKAFLHVLRCAGKYTFGRRSPWFFWFFFWTYPWKTAIGFVSPSNCHCQAIRLHYGCAYAILINMPVVLPFLRDHVTAHRSDTLCELTAEEIFNMADFFFFF